MRVRTFDSLTDLMTFFGFTNVGKIIQKDIDVVESACDLFERKRRDAEILSTLSGNCTGPFLEIGTSEGRSAAELACNNYTSTIYTVNLLPEQLTAGEELITHLLPKEQIGTYYRSLGCRNIVQIYENTSTWEVPAHIRDLGLLFIDGNHDTRAVFSDSNLLYERVAHGGFILWHDFSPQLRHKFSWIDAVMTGVEMFLHRNSLDVEIFHLKDSWIGFMRKTEAAASVRGIPISSTEALTTREYWSGKHSGPFSPWIVDRMLFSSLLERYLPKQKGLLCAELGAYPGGNLCYLAKNFGYKPVAVEFSNFSSHIDRLFEFNGIPDFEVLKEDVFSISDRQFDVVTSFGFVEHFSNYREAIRRHFDLAKPGGYIVISVPRFDGLQGTLFELAFEPEAYKEMIAAHCLEITDFNELKHAVLQCTDIILFCDYANDGIIYYDCNHPSLKGDKRWLIHFIQRISSIIGDSLPADKFFSPHILVIAQKPVHPFTPSEEIISQAVQSASQAISAGDYASALTFLESCIEKYPECRDPYRILADLQLKLGETSAAERTLHKVVERHPQSCEGFNSLGKLYAATGNEEASKAVNELMAIWHPGKCAASFASAPRLQFPASQPELTAITSVYPASYPVTVLARDHDIVTCSANGSIWKLDVTQYVDQAILANGIFEAESTYWVNQLVKEGMTALDVGANFGYYTVLLSKLVGPTGHVHAFEPSGLFHERLAEHVAINRCNNVTLCNVGLSDKEEYQQLLLDNSTASFFWHDDEKEPVSVETVHIRSLDNYVQTQGLERVDFIKIDIDGSEIRFLHGAEDTIKRFRPLLLIEFAQLVLLSAGGDVPTLARLLLQLGYALYSEKSGQAFTTEAQFLREACNCSHSVNIICIPNF